MNALGLSLAGYLILGLAAPNVWASGPVVGRPEQAERAAKLVKATSGILAAFQDPARLERLGSLCPKGTQNRNLTTVPLGFGHLEFFSGGGVAVAEGGDRTTFDRASLLLFAKDRRFGVIARLIRPGETAASDQPLTQATLSVALSPDGRRPFVAIQSTTVGPHVSTIVESREFMPLDFGSDTQKLAEGDKDSLAYWLKLPDVRPLLRSPIRLTLSDTQPKGSQINPQIANEVQGVVAAILAAMNQLDPHDRAVLEAAKGLLGNIQWEHL